MIRNTTTEAMTNTAMAIRVDIIMGTPAPKDSANDKLFIAFIGLIDARNPALSGVPEKNEHNAKKVNSAVMIEIVTLFFMN